MKSKSTRRTFLGGMVAGLAGATLTSGAAYAAWPSGPVHVIVPFPPGGGADFVARLLSSPLQSAFGAPFVVENRSGAAGRIGTGLVAKSNADGQTLLVTTESSIVIAPHMGVTMDYAPLKDLDPVSLLTRNTVVLVVNPSVPAKTLQEFMALARKEPGKILYGSSGVGGPNHLAAEIFKQKTGLDLVHVPFRGTGAALQGVIANQVGAMWGFMAGLIPHIRAGTLRALATGGVERSAELPDVPTFAEAGVPGYVAMSWIGLFAPHGMDPAIANKLAAAAHKAMEEPKAKEILLRSGSEIAGTTPEEFRKVVAADYEKYAKLSDLFKKH
jgi:tripartite-type tricarboxylate transporter receptor subunit TctC